MFLYKLLERKDSNIIELHDEHPRAFFVVCVESYVVFGCLLFSYIVVCLLARAQIERSSLTLSITRAAPAPTNAPLIFTESGDFLSPGDNIFHNQRNKHICEIKMQ